MLRLLYADLIKIRLNKDLLVCQQEWSKEIISKIINLIVEAEKSNKPEILE